MKFLPRLLIHNDAPKNHRAVYEFVQKFQGRYHRSPLWREIADATDLTTGQVRGILYRMRNKYPVVLHAEFISQSGEWVAIQRVLSPAATRYGYFNRVTSTLRETDETLTHTTQ